MTPKSSNDRWLRAIGNLNLFVIIDLEHLYFEYYGSSLMTVFFGNLIVWETNEPFSSWKTYLGVQIRSSYHTRNFYQRPCTLYKYVYILRHISSQKFVGLCLNIDIELNNFVLLKKSVTYNVRVRSSFI